MSSKSNNLIARIGREIRRRREDLLRERGDAYGLNHFAEGVDINPSSLSRIERGEQGFSLATLALIAEGLEVSVSDLILVAEGSTKPIVLDAQAALPVLSARDLFRINQEQPPAEGGRTMPERAREYNVPYASAPDEVTDGFIFLVNGPNARAMSGEYELGDKAVVSCEIKPEPGSHVIAVTGDEVVLRTYRMDRNTGEAILRPTNEEWPDIPLGGHPAVGIIGVVVERRQKMLPE